MENDEFTRKGISWRRIFLIALVVSVFTRMQILEVINIVEANQDMLNRMSATVHSIKIKNQKILDKEQENRIGLIELVGQAYSQKDIVELIYQSKKKLKKTCDGLNSINAYQINSVIVLVPECK